MTLTYYSDLAIRLFSRHLLPPLFAEDGKIPRVVLNSDTRLKLYHVVLQLIKDDGERLHTMIKCLSDGICPVPIPSTEGTDG